MTPPRRASDPDDCSEHEKRSNGLEIGFGRWRVRARGALALILVGFLSVVLVVTMLVSRWCL